MTVTQLADRIGITLANLSILKTGKARAVTGSQPSRRFARFCSVSPGICSNMRLQGSQMKRPRPQPLVQSSSVNWFLFEKTRDPDDRRIAGPSVRPARGSAAAGYDSASPVLLSTGTRLGPYEIIAPIGVGGMGEVYKALDTRLNRIVAIKKGLAPFSERFEREAHAIASLNHPHICSLYDVGPDYLVMEYIEGKPLAGPVDPDEALVLARQILDAIDAAHRTGIVHRDLKPANILVTRSGVKLLDFGLAKASAELAANMATVGGPATGVGTILGTLQYMSPEQLEAKDADARSDIFAFGAVLYELITGKRAFEGSTPASVIASILKGQPQPITQLSPMTSTGIDRVVQTCLEKDPDRRWQSAREVKHALDWVSRDALATPDHQELKTAGTRSLRLWQAATGAAALAMVGVMVWANRPPAAPTAVPVRFHIAPPAGASFETYVALSPNGQRLAFSATGADGIVRLWYRDLMNVEPRMLPGTEGAQSAFWSPDSRHLAFGFRNQLKKIDPSGGPPQTLCEVEGPVGSGTWSQEGVILFGRRGVVA